MTRALLRVVAATGVAAATALGGPAPAHAAACDSSDGVTVVVDFHELGGGVQQSCDGDGGGEKASALFPDNGYSLTYVQRQPGFVCRVQGKPADDPCVNTPPADAYWGLWWSDGESGGWTYSSTGVGSLKVPDGGAVALSWNGSSAKSPPGASPPQHPSEPEPTQSPGPSHPAQPPKSPSSHPSAPSSGAPRGPASASAGAASPSAARTGGGHAQHDGHRGGGPEKGERKHREKQSEGPSATPPSTTPSPVGAASEAPDPDDGGLPIWVAPTSIGGLFVAAGGVAYLRRRAA